MQSLSEVNLSDFKQALAQGEVRILRIIFSGLAAGVLFFAFLVFLIYRQRVSADYDPASIQFLNILSIVNIIMTVAAIVIGKLLADRQFSEGNLARAIEKDYKNKAGVSLNLSPAQRCLAIIRAAFILRIAMMEGAAYFGLAIALVVITSGMEAVEPAYLLNAATALPVLRYILINFPSAEKLEEVFKTRIQKSS